MTVTTVTEHKCRKCGANLFTTEVQACKDRCVTCYTKAVRFVLSQNSKELHQLNAEHTTLQTRFNELLEEQKALCEVLESIKKTA